MIVISQLKQPDFGASLNPFFSMVQFVIEHSCLKLYLYARNKLCVSGYRDIAHTYELRRDREERAKYKQHVSLTSF